MYMYFLCICIYTWFIRYLSVCTSKYINTYTCAQMSDQNDLHKIFVCMYIKIYKYVHVYTNV